MTHSAYSAHVPFDPTAIDAADPLATGIGRVMVNNALYLCDSAAQHRVSFHASELAAIIGIDDSAGDFVAGSWFPILRVPFLAHAHPDGGAFRFRVRLGGATDGHASATVTYRLAIGSETMIDDGLSATAVPSWAREYTQTGSTHAWLAPTGGGDNLIVVPLEQVAESVTSQSSVVSVGGARTAVAVLRLAFVVLATSDDVQSTARPMISAVSVEEYVGT